MKQFIKSIPTLPRGAGDRASFKFGNCTYSCLNDDESVQAFAEKLALRVKQGCYKATHATKVSRPGTGRPGAQGVIDQFIIDGELDNAIEYARLRGVNVYYYAGFPDGEKLPLVKCKLIEPGYVLGNTGKQWTVTHLDSGYAVGHGKNRPAALENFAEQRAHPEYEERLAKVAKGFQ